MMILCLMEQQLEDRYETQHKRTAKVRSESRFLAVALGTRLELITF